MIPRDSDPQLSAEWWHGTPGGYNNHKCRKPCCRNAWRIYRLKANVDARRARRLQERAS